MIGWPAPVLFFIAGAIAANGAIRVQLTQRDGGKIVDLPLEQYVAAVLAGEVGAFKSDEALKAMAVAARTYGIRLKGRHASRGFDLCSTTHCQFADVRAIKPRVEQAAEATAGEMLWYEGKLALTYYSQDCGGRTEDASAVWSGSSVPYLKSRDDEYCVRGGKFNWQWTSTAAQLGSALRASGLKAPSVLNRISILRRSQTGRATMLALSGAGESVPLSASSLRFALGRTLGWNTLRSERWDVQSVDGRFVFQGSGAGHGAGLCQRGADRMGVEGRSYREILAHYYQGAMVGLTARGLKWTRLGGERVAVMTPYPDRDAGMVAIADRTARDLSLAPPIEIRIYPDVETFRNATGEPGWVAAHAAGRRIHMQPQVGAVVERTLRHELLHIMVEERAAPGIPLWFREGLVAYLASRSTQGTGHAPEDAAIRQTTDAARARQANHDARRRIAELVQRHGEPAVLEWLKRGLPPEVRGSP